MGMAFGACEKENVVENVPSYTLKVSLDEPDSTYLGKDTSVPHGYYYRDDIEMEQFVLTHSFGSYGFGEGCTYTNCTDKTTPGYTNLSAITGIGVSTNGYFTINAAAYEGSLPAEVSFKDGRAYKAKECFVTNSTYAYLAIKETNDGTGEYPLVKKWTSSDQFKLTITGFNGQTQTGIVEFLLADGMNIVDSWERVDLSKLGYVTKLRFNLSSTDVGEWGMNTPSYFCLDHLTVTE